MRKDSFERLNFLINRKKSERVVEETTEMVFSNDYSLTELQFSCDNALNITSQYDPFWE